MNIGYQFNNQALLKNALTHSSYANENREKGVKSNERLEFLGDSVLGMISAEYIYSGFKDLSEGEMTKLRAVIVCEQSLFEYATELGLGDLILLGKGESIGGGKNRPSLLADAMEALIAAVYLDGGLEQARSFTLPFLKGKAEGTLKSRVASDYKTALQEIVQKNHEETLSYRLKEESGPDHDKRFVIEVLINSNVISTGEGKSKKQAEQAAAKAALELMGQ